MEDWIKYVNLWFEFWRSTFFNEYTWYFVVACFLIYVISAVRTSRLNPFFTKPLEKIFKGNYSIGWRAFQEHLYNRAPDSFWVPGVSDLKNGEGFDVELQTGLQNSSPF